MDYRPSTINDELRPHGTYLTREMTEFDPVYASKKGEREVKLRPAYIQLDILNPGDIFVSNSVSIEYTNIM